MESKKQVTQPSLSPWRASYLHRRALAVQRRAHARAPSTCAPDCACSTSHPETVLTSRSLRPYAAEYVGLDRSNDPLVDVVPNAQMLPFPDAAPLTAACAVRCLRHAADPAVVLSEASLVLRPEGIAFILMALLSSWG